MMMEKLLSGKPPMPGFRFHPTDEELFMYYLKRKVLGKPVYLPFMPELDVYRYAPWELPKIMLIKSRELNWYFFCPREKKYPNGGRANRATVHGYWKSTGNDRTVSYNSQTVGKIKTLIFHRGKAPKGDRTNWVMHEYKLEAAVVAGKGVSSDSYVICKIYEKSGLGPKNGENYGAPFVEEEWESDDECNTEQGVTSGTVLQGPSNVCVGGSPDGSDSVLTFGTSNIDNAPAANVCSTSFTSAIEHTPCTAAASVGVASLGAPYVTAAAGTPCVMAASTGLEIVAATSGGTACAFADFVGAASNGAAFLGDGSDTTQLAPGNGIDTTLLVPSDGIDGLSPADDHLQGLLDSCTEDHPESLADIYSELGNLDDSWGPDGRWNGLWNGEYDLCIREDDLWIGLEDIK